jgi:hypothetical protein
MAVPYTFGSATTSIPLSQLDSNFATTITLGNTAVQLGNTITTLTGVTNLASSGALTLGSNGNTTAVYVDTSQNVGIGTTSPVSKFHVYGSGQIGTVESSGNYATSGAGYVRWKDVNGNAAFVGFGGNANNFDIFNSLAGAVTFSTSATERVRIDSSGQAIIGSTSVGRGDKLTVVGASTLSTVTSSVRGLLAVESDTATAQNVGGSISLGGNYDGGRTQYGAIGGFKESTTSSEYGGYLALFTRPNGDVTKERMRITSSGFLKASNTGSYQNVSQNYAEFSTDQSNTYGFLIGITNASYASDGLTTSFTQRSSSSSFSAFKIYTSGGNTLSYIRGDGNAYTDGTWNNNGADYAEFFESANGQALTLGATVVLDGNKIREATDQDDAKNIIGVVRPKEPSKASMIVGNTAWNKWANQYLSDDFDRYIMEDHDVVEWTDENGKTHTYESQSIPSGITVPSDATRKTHDENGIKFQHYKVNPQWNPDAEYVNRENRPEWNIIGLLGQVKLLKGKPVGDRWTKMRDVSDSVEEWFIR